MLHNIFGNFVTISQEHRYYSVKDPEQVTRSILTSTFLRLRDRLRGMAIGIVGSQEDADDVLNDAFCKLWIGHRDVEREIEAIKLSYTAVRNSAIDVVRYRKSHPVVPEEYLCDMSVNMDSNEANDTKEICEVMLSLSRRVLNERQYRVFIMHDVDNMSYSEIASALGLNQDNVRAILSRARKAIREFYRKRYING